MATNTWFQDGSPESYKIQLLYYDIPKHLIKEKYVDTPYRFKNFDEAESTAAGLFPGIRYKIIGSSDKPHFSKPPVARMTREQVQKQPFYDVHGITPSYRVDSSIADVEENLSPMDKQSFEELKKLRRPGI